MRRLITLRDPKVKRHRAHPARKLPFRLDPFRPRSGTSLQARGSETLKSAAKAASFDGSARQPLTESNQFMVEPIWLFPHGDVPTLFEDDQFAAADLCRQVLTMF